MSLVMSLWNNTKIFTVMFITSLIINCFLFFSQQNFASTIEHGDKYGHVLVFFVLSLLIYKGSKLTTSIQIILLTVFGIMVEIIQSYIPYRSGSVDDVMADILGIALFYTFAPLVVKKLRSQSKLTSKTI